jgi:hypothetical protein
MPARVDTYALGPGRAPAIESVIKNVFKDVREQWYVSILGSQGNPSRWRMTIETPDGEQTTRNLDNKCGEHRTEYLKQHLEMALAKWEER